MLFIVDLRIPLLGICMRKWSLGSFDHPHRPTYAVQATKRGASLIEVAVRKRGDSVYSGAHV